MDVEIKLLVERAQGGEQEAYGELYERLAPQIYRYIYYRVGGNTHLAEDLTEDVFLKLLEKLDRYEDRGLPFTAWLYRIAHNHVTDHFRRQASLAVVSIDEQWSLADERALGTLDTALTSDILAKALRRLTDDQRQVIVLRFLEDRSIAETATILGKTEDGTKKAQMRGLAGLRRILGSSSLAELAA